MVKLRPTRLFLAALALFTCINVVWLNRIPEGCSTSLQEGKSTPEDLLPVIPTTHCALQVSSNNFTRDNPCTRRHEELNEQLRVESEIRKEFLEQLYHRQVQDEYHRSNATAVQESQMAKSTMIQRILGNDFPNPQFRPKPEWIQQDKNATVVVATPDILILGFQKAGTTQLYQLLASHADTVGLKGKEYCMDPSHRLNYDDEEELSQEQRIEWHRKLHSWHADMFQKRKNSPSKILNGCLNLDELEFRFQYLSALPTNSKCILIFRDPADWMWAVMHFWYDHHLDTNSPDDHDYLSPKLHYRSPELFHEWVLSGEQLYSAYRKFKTFRQRSVEATRQLIHLVGRNNVLLLRNEDLTPERIESSGLLSQLETTLRLSPNGWDRRVMHSRSNCNAHKGKKTCPNATSKSSSAYPITRHRSMLSTTRELLYLQWREECEIWAEEFNIVYPDCLKAGRQD